jgi:hypothetical protein
MSWPIRPTFVQTIAALRTTDPRFPWVKPAPEEDDVAASLEAVEEVHQGDADEPDERIHWGHCRGCGQWWPCPTWIESEFLAVQYLGRAADRVTRHFRDVWDDLQAKRISEAVPHPRHESPEQEPA